MATAALFIARARQLVGVPYVLGAEWGQDCTAPCVPPAVDCSELVEGLFREAGCPIGDLAAAQYDKTVDVGDVRTGDLVFLRNNRARWNGIGHVAVVTAPLADGDWEVIEARGSRWGTVRTTLSYWSRRAGFAGVRRFPGLRFDDGDPAAPLAQQAGLREDGAFGPRTKRALQARIGTNPDGVWGPASRLALQRWLGVHADGIVGPTTVRALQARIGTNPDGVWGPATTRALQHYLNATTSA